MNQVPRRRGSKSRVETFRVSMTRDEADEIRSLLRDEEGDADEDLLDGVYEALRGRKRDTERAVTVRLTKRQKESVFRALDDEGRESDESYIAEVLVELDLAIAKHSRDNH
jgi:hypothetical protein